MAYKGKYKIKNPDKYLGKIDKCIYRSSWERSLMYFCDISPKVLKWGAEVVKIPYVCETDLELHTYIIDFVIQFRTKKWYLIEVKPDKQTRSPKKKTPKNNRQKYRAIKEEFTWAKNRSKWRAAKAFADKKGMTFSVWTEKDLRSLGLTIL